MSPFVVINLCKFVYVVALLYNRVVLFEYNYQFFFRFLFIIMYVYRIVYTFNNYFLIYLSFETKHLYYEIGITNIC